MRSGSWRLLIGEFLINEINRLWPHGKAIGSVFLFFLFILNKWQITFPGPGILNICGMRYELSGSSYLVVPKVLPLFLECYTKVLI